MILPRVGWEVPVMYREGDPDFPIVLGRAYNPGTSAPYGLPDKKATTSFQSATSPHDGTTNELRMADDAGSQEMFLHASRDQTVQVGGSSTLDVTLNEVHDVGLSYTLVVKTAQTHTVGAKRSVTIGTDHTNKVKGARSETIGGVDHAKVSGNRLIDVSGAYTELVGGVYGIQCNQLNTDVGGGYLQVVGGSAAHTAGMGCSETVAGARALAVGGAETLVLRADFSEKTIGPKTSTIGNVKTTAAADIGTKHKGTAKVTVGGAANVKAGAVVSVTAPKIQVDIKGALDASGLKLDGGTFNVKKGTTKLDGNIKRKGGSKIE
jgi:type VI secretion system secreted protein VgrG